MLKRIVWGVFNNIPLGVFAPYVLGFLLGAKPRWKGGDK